MNERDREIDRDRETERHTERERKRVRERQRERETERDRDRERDREVKQKKDFRKASNTYSATVHKKNSRLNIFLSSSVQQKFSELIMYEHNAVLTRSLLLQVHTIRISEHLPLNKLKYTFGE